MGPRRTVTTLAAERDALVDQILQDARRQVEALRRLTSQLIEETDPKKERE